MLDDDVVVRERPRVCREFAVKSEACLHARWWMQFKIENIARGPRGYGVDWRATV